MDHKIHSLREITKGQLLNGKIHWVSFYTVQIRKSMNGAFNFISYIMKVPLNWDYIIFGFSCGSKNITSILAC